jgi:hypothetical protein
MTVVGDTVALLLTREGGGSEQVVAPAPLVAPVFFPTNFQSIVLTQCRGAAIDNQKLLTCDKVSGAT